MRKPFEVPRRLWIVRHGVSTFNASGRYQGCSDEPELTVEGRQAAVRTGRHLSAWGIRRIVTSPLRRAAETAREIGACQAGSPAPGVPIDEDERLREIDLPQWEGLSFAEVRQRFPAQYEAWWLHPESMRMTSTGGEILYPVRNLFQRIGHFWNDLWTDRETGDILVVTHGGAGRALLCIALGFGPERFHELQLSNCGISRLMLSSARSHRGVLEFLNSTSHLGDRLPKLKEGRTGTRYLLIATKAGAPGWTALPARIIEDTPIESALIAASDAGAAGDLFRRRSPCALQCVPPEILGLRVLEAGKRGSESPLANVAVIAEAGILQLALGALFDGVDVRSGLFPLQPATITALHCPAGGRRSVLQGMNLFPKEE